MPKDLIDYSNTIIYKIYCKDVNIKDIYVGHTTNFVNRKYIHKSSCNNLKNNVKIYDVIRKNGGWDNWDMVEIAKYNCKDSSEARIKEQELYMSLNASLNIRSPYDSSHNSNKNTNLFLEKDKIKCEEIIGNSQNPKKYHCNYCDYSTSKKTNYDKHIQTDKHKMATNGNLEVAETEFHGHKCQYCKQKYKTNSGLWKHIKKCIQTNKTKMIIDVIKDDKNVQEFLMEQNKLLIEQLSQQNKKLIEQNNKLIELSQGNTIGTINNTVNNNNNKFNNKFNINVFLNETCKDAINLTDFVNQITLSLEDLEETSKVGYAEGISNVFIRNLKDIDYKERPIHCNDFKREVLYIKDDNQWVKDNKKKLTNAIKIVANKNIKQIPDWQKANPEYNNPKSKQNDKYMKMLCEVMSGSSKEEQQKNYNKVIKNISKEVIINKDMLSS